MSSARGYNSVKRFVATLKFRDPERFDVLEFLPGEEAQVDLAWVRPPCARASTSRPYLFVMTLKYSGKCFRKGGVEDGPGDLVPPARGGLRSFGGARRTSCSTT